MDMHALDNAHLTEASDWNTYYNHRTIASMQKCAQEVSLIDEWLINKNGKIFELGFGGSTLLSRSAFLGWQVGGVDFNQDAVALTKEYFKSQKVDTQDLYYGDAFDFDTNPLRDSCDILISNGFLEHFVDPSILLAKYKSIVKKDGIIISMIPNLLSINACFLKKYDPATWKHHFVISNDQLDYFHEKAGYNIVNRAHSFGKYNIHMLIPWNCIYSKINNKLLFKMIKLPATLIAAPLLGLLPNKGMQSLNPKILGVYRKG